METLTEIFKEIGHFGNDIGANDKGSTHTYTGVYDTLFAPFREGATMMEIGLATGDSIDLWDRYFENSRIIGVDLSIVFKIKKYRNQVQLLEGDATKEKTFAMLGLTTFDIVIDDGSHMTNDQIATFNLLKSRMRKGAVYVIEDILSLDIEKHRYLSLHENVQIVDMRDNGRFDNALVVIHF